MMDTVERILKINLEIIKPLLVYIKVERKGDVVRNAIHFFYEHIVSAQGVGNNFVLEKDKRRIPLSVESLFLIKEQSCENKDLSEIVFLSDERRELKEVIESSRRYNPEKSVEQIAEQLLRSYVAIGLHLVHEWKFFREKDGKKVEINTGIKKELNQEFSEKIPFFSWPSFLMEERGAR